MANEQKYRTVTISCKIGELLDKLNEEYGIVRGRAIEKALEEKYGEMLKEKK